MSIREGSLGRLCGGVTQAAGIGGTETYGSNRFREGVELNWPPLA